MTRGRMIAAWLGLATLAAMSTCAPIAPAEAEATGPAIAIGSVGAADGDRRASRALRRALSVELAHLAGVRVSEPRRARWVLQGAVTSLERRQLARNVEVECTVSLVVADAQGNVRVILNGRAGARGGAAEHVEETALQAAVRGALRPLPDELGSGPP